MPWNHLRPGHTVATRSWVLFKTSHTVTVDVSGHSVNRHLDGHIYSWRACTSTHYVTKDQCSWLVLSFRTNRVEAPSRTDRVQVPSEIDRVQVPSRTDRVGGPSSYWNCSKVEGQWKE